MALCACLAAWSLPCFWPRSQAVKWQAVIEKSGKMIGAPRPAPRCAPRAPGLPAAAPWPSASSRRSGCDEALTRCDERCASRALTGLDDGCTRTCTAGSPCCYTVGCSSINLGLQAPNSKTGGRSTGPPVQEGRDTRPGGESGVVLWTVTNKDESSCLILPAIPKFRIVFEQTVSPKKANRRRSSSLLGPRAAVQRYETVCCAYRLAFISMINTSSCYFSLSLCLSRSRTLSLPLLQSLRPLSFGLALAPWGVCLEVSCVCT